MQRDTWRIEGVGVTLTTYGIISAGPSAGLIETVMGSCSVHGLKKKAYEERRKTSLTAIYRHVHGERFDDAVRRFVTTLAATSVVCYLLQVKDRHNGNILVDEHG